MTPMRDNPSGAIIIAGHSHAAALVGACDTEGPDTCLLPVPGYDRVFGLHGPSLEGFPVRTNDYWSALARCGTGNAIGLVYGGNEANWSFLFEEAVPFDFVPRHHPDMPLAPDAVIVPEAQIRAEIDRNLGCDLRDVLALLTQQTDARVLLVSPPPPKGDQRRLQELLPPAAAGARITSPHVRLKLWHVLVERYQECASEHGVEFVSVPETVIDEGGFLKPEYWAADLTHGNQEYAKTMLELLLRIVGSG
jgi:hypothetical protein